MHLQLHMPCKIFYARWKRMVLREWGVLIFYRPGTFVISVGTPERNVPHIAARVRTVHVEFYGDLANDKCVYCTNAGLRQALGTCMKSSIVHN